MAHLLTDVPRLPDEALRLVHGRGHCISGAEDFNIEWLPPLILVVAYTPLSESQLAVIISECSARPEVASIYLQMRDQHKAPLRHLWGEATLPRTATEHGLSYLIDLGINQNFGLFLDMALGRQWVQQHAEGKKVLNLFSYTCAFAVSAICGGAELVVNLDMSKAALSVGRENLRLNGLDTSKVKFFAHDLFKSWGKLRKFGPYQLVIADPPSMQQGSFNVEKDYVRIVRQLPRLVAEGGQALLCLNAPWLDQQFLLDAVASEAPQFRFIQTLPRPALVKEASADAGLKVMLFEKLA